MNHNYQRGLSDALNGNDSPTPDNETPAYWAGYSEGMRRNHVFDTYHYVGPADGVVDHGTSISHS